MPSDSDPHTFNIRGTVIRETERAVLVAVEQWIPKGQIKEIGYIDATPSIEPLPGKRFTSLVLPFWLGKAKGWFDTRGDDGGRR
jgi:hypothetical protein